MPPLPSHPSLTVWAAPGPSKPPPPPRPSGQGPLLQVAQRGSGGRTTEAGHLLIATDGPVGPRPLRSVQMPSPPHPHPRPAGQRLLLEHRSKCIRANPLVSPRKRTRPAESESSTHWEAVTEPGPELPARGPQQLPGGLRPTARGFGPEGALGEFAQGPRCWALNDDAPFLLPSPWFYRQHLGSQQNQRRPPPHPLEEGGALCGSAAPRARVIAQAGPKPVVPGMLAALAPPPCLPTV